MLGFTVDGVYEMQCGSPCSMRTGRLLTYEASKRQGQGRHSGVCDSAQLLGSLGHAFPSSVLVTTVSVLFALSQRCLHRVVT